jgi:hypothetical protein
MSRIFILFLLVTLSLTFTAFAQDEAIHQWAVSAEASSEFGSVSWSAGQATGEPNALECTDSPSAWASAASNEVATLTVYFGVPVIPSEINIHQNFNPGAIDEITLITVAGDEIELDDEGEAPDDCPGVHVVEVEDINDAVNGVIIEVDQREIGNWSEIDAVELVGVPVPGLAASQWATSAEASSEYGSDSWSAKQATGVPDVDGCGDAVGAWASATATEVATLTVYFDIPVAPLAVNIYQNYNPGAIVSLELLGVDGESYEFEVTPEEATVECPGVVSIAFEESDILVDGVVITVDQSITGNWSEIDAVELVGVALGGDEVSTLPETLEQDGFSISYPSDWATTIDENDIPVLASSEDALTSRNQLEDGDVVITIILPTALEDELDLDADGDIEDILQAILDTAEVEAEIEDYDVLDNQAVIANIALEDTPGEATLIMVKYDDGAVFYGIDTGGAYEDVEPLVVAILNSATYED